jgi:hypothetical protein
MSRRRKLPPSPCIMYTAEYSSTMAECTHCEAQTNICLQSWIDIAYRDELIGRGFTLEYASQLAVGSAIRHQRKPDAQPFATGYICSQHLLDAMRVALRFDMVTSALRSIHSRFVPGRMLVIFDKNRHVRERTDPTATVGEYRDIHHFVEVYTQLDEEGQIE